MSTQIEPLLTITDLDVMPEDENRYELIEGELFVSRAPSLFHQVIVSNIIALVRPYLDLNPIGMIVPGPGVIFSQLSGVIPDLVFISNEQRGEIAFGEKVTGAPALVIEVLSPGAENERRDRVVKRQLHAKYGVKEYWIADSEKRAVEVYVLVGESLTLSAVFTDQDEITSELLPGFRCTVESILSI